MVRRTTQLLGVVGALLIVPVWYAVSQPHLVEPVQEQQPATRLPIMEGLLFQAYDQDTHGAKVQAARAYAGNKRWGFFQLALIPTVELEDVTVEYTAANGTQVQEHWPTAVMELSTHQLHTPSGTFNVRPQARRGSPAT